MKEARASDFWRKAYVRPFGVSVSKISYETVPGLGTGGVNFRGGITVVCGANGTGKSTLLHAVNAVLSQSAAEAEFVKARIEAGKFLAEIASNGVVRTMALPAQGVEDREPISVVRIDASSESAELRRRFAEMANFDELLESVSPTIADDKALERMSYLVGRKYEKIAIYELDAFEPLIPYFRVSSQGIEYGSEEMGLGELALHILDWRMKQAERSSILLLEEPEAHISLGSQSALMDVVAESVCTRDIWVVITTHSPTVVSRVPNDHVRLLYRSQQNEVKVVDSPTPAGWNYALGVMPHKDAVVLTEDRAAEAFVRMSVRRFAPHIHHRLEFGSPLSATELLQALRYMPSLPPWFVLIGCLDGDMRAHKAHVPGWPAVYLPGNSDPLSLLLAAGLKNPQDLAGRAQKNVVDVEMAIVGTEGVEVHDRLRRLAERLQLAEHELRQILFEVYCGDPAREEECKSFCVALEAALVDGYVANLPTAVPASAVVVAAPLT